MEKIVTGDGSITFRSDDCGEPYHSKSGAMEEAFKKFAEPSNLKPGDIVLDFCFGLGYNSLAAIHLVDGLKVIGLENDPEILKKISSVEVDPGLKKDYLKIKNAALNLRYRDEGVDIMILLGDARESVKKIEDKVSAVFFDPFSLPKCPEMWSLEVFKDVYCVMKKGGVLTTYSCARKVRDNLRKAGFEVKDGPCIGRRSCSTIAVK